jgi:hypothetical protein
MRKQLLAIAVSAATMIPSLAVAGVISIAACEAPCVPVALPGSGVTNEFSVDLFPTGNFLSNIGGISQPLGNTTLLLTANNISVSAGGGTGATLDIWVTASDITVPLANPLDVLSGLTQNLITPGWSSTLSTFLSPTNQLFTGTPLFSDTFGAIDSSSQLDLINTGAGPYSVTAQFHIVSNGEEGGSNATIVMIPGPIVGAGLPGLIAACLGLIGLQRRRRRKQLAA